MTQPDPLPILPVIEYADGRPGQPLDSLFTVAETAGGVTLTKPLAAQPVHAAVCAALSLGLAGICLAAVWSLLSDLGRPWYEYALAPIPLAAPACFAAAAFIYAAAVRRRRLLSIDVDSTGLAITNGRVTFGNRPWRLCHPIRFRAGFSRPDLDLRLYSPLSVKAGRGMERQVLARVPTAECQWLVGVLNAAASRAATASADRGIRMT